MNRQQRIRADGGIEPIEFYHPRDPFGVFSNFSAHDVVLPHPFTGESVAYRTGEHRFQAMKATTHEDHDLVADPRNSSYQAKEKGGPRGILLRPGWGSDYGDLCWYVMAELILAKAIQHALVAHALKRTIVDGEWLPIWEDSPKDEIWGIRQGDLYNGRNLLGRAWMQARDVLVDGVYIGPG